MFVSVLLSSFNEYLQCKIFRTIFSSCHLCNIIPSKIGYGEISLKYEGGSHNNAKLSVSVKT